MRLSFMKGIWHKLYHAVSFSSFSRAEHPSEARHHGGLLILLFLILIGAVLFIIQGLFESEFPLADSQKTLVSNLSFFLLININIILVMVLVFLVVRNMVRLLLDRRRKILGAKLRSRLVFAFVGLSLVPTVLLFIVAKGMLEKVMHGWFSPQISESVEGAVEIARQHHKLSETQLFRQCVFLSQGVASINNVSQKDFLIGVQNYLDIKRQEYDLFRLSVLDKEGSVVAFSESDIAQEGIIAPDVNMNFLRKALDGEIIIKVEEAGGSEFISGYIPVLQNAVSKFYKNSSVKELSGKPSGKKNNDQEPKYLVLANVRAIPELNAALLNVLDSFDSYRELNTYQRPLASSYLLTLVVVTLLVIFGATWVGFYLSKGMTVPLGLLANATQQIAQGNLSGQIPEVGDDELSVLVHSFNVMTHDLRETTDELVARRQYMETVLASLGVGVLSVDREGLITTLNPAAAQMLGISNGAGVLKRSFREIMSREVCLELGSLLENVFSGTETVQTANVSLPLSAGARHIQLTISQLTDGERSCIGAVILFDDLTELISAQRMAAWREVARRIAHEIKNPLTPIQLSAERMQRRFKQVDINNRFSSVGSDSSLILEATDIIIKQVSILRNLVNEFSRFARMPRAQIRLADLNAVISDTVSAFRASHGDIKFTINLDSDIPKFGLDTEQISRALTNLLENSVASIRMFSLRLVEGLDYVGEIKVVSVYDSSLGIAIIEVSDNGQGVSDEYRARVFEPYFSTRSGGTGLGLTIVSSIVSDHNGFIRIRDNKPHGVIFVIELPISKDLRS